jgi:hypothetical protein
MSRRQRGGARIRIRPQTGEVLHANGKPVKGIKLVNGTMLVRTPQVSRNERDFVRDLALVASGTTGLTTDDVIRLADLRRRARRASQSPSEVWAELAEEMEAKPVQEIDLTKSHLRTPVRRRPDPSLAASAALAPLPPKGLVSVSVHDGGVVRDRHGRPVDGARFSFETGRFLRVQTFAEESASLQAQEDELAADRKSGGVRGLVKRGFQMISDRLERLEQRPEPSIVVNVPKAEPPVVNVTLPAPVVNVAAPRAPKAPDVFVTVQQPRPSSVRMEIDEDGTRRFIPEEAT